MADHRADNWLCSCGWVPVHRRTYCFVHWHQLSVGVDAVCCGLLFRRSHLPVLAIEWRLQRCRLLRPRNIFLLFFFVCSDHWTVHLLVTARVCGRRLQPVCTRIPSGCDRRRCAVCKAEGVWRAAMCCGALCCVVTPIRRIDALSGHLSSYHRRVTPPLSSPFEQATVPYRSSSSGLSTAGIASIAAVGVLVVGVVAVLSYLRVRNARRRSRGTSTSPTTGHAERSVISPLHALGVTGTPTVAAGAGSAATVAPATATTGYPSNHYYYGTGVNSAPVSKVKPTGGSSGAGVAPVAVDDVDIGSPMSTTPAGRALARGSAAVRGVAVADNAVSTRRNAHRSSERSRFSALSPRHGANGDDEDDDEPRGVMPGTPVGSGPSLSNW
jgi:hypothetical protein